MNKYCNSMKSKTGTLIECKACESDLCNGIDMDKKANQNGLDGYSGKMERSDGSRGNNSGNNIELKIVLVLFAFLLNLMKL